MAVWSQISDAERTGYFISKGILLHTTFSVRHTPKTLQSETKESSMGTVLEVIVVIEIINNRPQSLKM
jgi:hypothetical protein